MPDVEKVIKGLEVILEETADMYYRSTVQDALALLKAQEPAYVEERLVLDKLSNIQDYARVNEINWMADGAAYAETVIGALQGRISALLKAQEPGRRGKWKRVEPGVIVCTECHYPQAKTRIFDEDGHESYVFLLPPYCPMCGAKMDAGAPVFRPGCDN